jgi:hypothetical protein
VGCHCNRGVGETLIDSVCLAIEVLLFAAAEHNARPLLRESLPDRAAKAATAASHYCHTLIELEVRHG